MPLYRFCRLLVSVGLIGFILLPVSATRADDGISDPASNLNGPAAQISGGGSAADGGALQPAGTNTLQSAPIDAGGLTAPSANTLQAPAASDGSLRVLAGEADGSPNHPTDNDNQQNWYWLAGCMLVGLVLAAPSWWWLRHRPPRR
jgi:hypothetical protein